MRVNLIIISGAWKSGFVLDKHVAHSEYISHNEFGQAEYDTVRTEVGEAIYQLKYRSDLKQIEPLARIMANTVRASFPSVGFVVPMPPSKARATQPLVMLAKKVAEFLDIPFFEKILMKKAATPQMKDIATKEEKVSALINSFYINDAISNEGKWDVLLIDDLYSSGASMSSATKSLRMYHKINDIYAVAFTRTRRS